MGKVQLRAPYSDDYDPDAVSLENGLHTPEDARGADQSFAEECDINELMRRFGQGVPMPENFAMPMSGDFTAAMDFQESMQLLRAAQESFMELPAEMRARFANDPARLISFLEDGANRDEAVRLGLVSAPVEATRTGEVVAPVSPPVSPPVAP